ncbi:MAG: type III pantothenate kinase [Cytophagaceae bacterium SCN 52-12]|nr:MAG: type III pantothenate kinase [Cytophagaceae bacterium SCN 52-12]
MLLAVDIGNTDIVFGVYEAGEPVHIWRTPTLSGLPAYHYQAFIQLQMLEAGVSAGRFDTAVISSVVPGITAAISDLVENLLAIKPVLVSADTYPALRLEIDYPHELGSDLIANAVAAYTRFKRNCVIVDFGTALTFTAVTGDGRVPGVAIVPGLMTAVKALFNNTARLPEVPLVLPETAIGKNTMHSIQSGILIGYEGLVRNLLARFKKELGQDAVAIATGGLSSIIGTLAEDFTDTDPTLTLEGLRIIGEYVHTRKPPAGL